MIPIRNRKKTLEMTVEEMRNFAVAYVDKYAPSKQQVKTYLLKKYLKAAVPNVKKQDITNLIDIVLSDLEQTHLSIFDRLSRKKVVSRDLRAKILKSILQVLREKQFESCSI